MAKAVIVSASPDRDRHARRRAGPAARHQARRDRRPGGDRAGRSSTPEQVDEVILGQRAAGRPRAEPVARRGARGGLPKEVPVYGVNKACGSGLKAVALAAQSIAARRRRRRRRGRHGEHERRALPPEEGALRHPHGPRSAPRLDDRRRPHLSDHARAHGRSPPRTSPPSTDLARGAGRVRGREPGEGGRGHQGRQVQGRDRPGRGPGREEGRDRSSSRPTSIRAPDTKAEKLGDAAARLQEGRRLGHGRQRVGHQRRRRGAGRHVGREGARRSA